MTLEVSIYQLNRHHNLCPKPTYPSLSKVFSHILISLLLFPVPPLLPHFFFLVLIIIIIIPVIIIL